MRFKTMITNGHRSRPWCPDSMSLWVQIDLGDDLESPSFVYVDEHAGFYPEQFRRKRYGFEMLRYPAYSPEKRLQDLGQIRHEKCEKCGGHQLRHPSAAGGAPLVSPHRDGTIVIGLGKLASIREQQRPQQPICEAMVDVFDVRINVDEDVSRVLLPRVPCPWVPDVAACGCRVPSRHRTGLLRGSCPFEPESITTIIEKRVMRHGVRFHDDDLLGDRLFLVQGGQTQGDGKPFTLLLRHQAIEILEFGNGRKVFDLIVFSFIAHPSMAMTRAGSE